MAIIIFLTLKSIKSRLLNTYTFMVHSCQWIKRGSTVQRKKTETQVAIIGGGIMGTAIARELSKYHVDVCLIEKEAGIGFGITKGSLGLLHSALGLSSSKLVKWWDSSGDIKAYFSQPLRMKEKFNIAGHKMFLELEPQLNAKIHKCGRIMVARDEKDREKAMDLLEAHFLDVKNRLQSLKKRE